MSELYKTWPSELYFVTFTVTGWVHVFARDIYKDIIIKNLQLYREKVCMYSSARPDSPFKTLIY